ncbi:hypothetical protein [Paraburkholderia sp. MM5477-R1]|uniref:hypothetical protein n=1 Tax=Paraburkholderia sp. MM5477-R1 TaxID=2991062 RepID=UPI003D249365
MARIRSIKPEFWTSAQIMDLSIPARLLFIGLWNFCDDAGIHPASEKRLKAEVFPADDVSVSDVRGLIAELARVGLLTEYAIDNELYWQVTGWHHQKIDQPTFKHPRPDGSVPAAAAKRRANRMVNIPAPPIEATFDERASDVRRTPCEQSANGRGAFGDCSPTEGKGVEGKGKEAITNTDVLVVASDADEHAKERPHAKKPDCPHQGIIALYHELLPASPAIRDWTPTRAAHLRARWNEDGKRQSLEWWRRFFAYVAGCGFLTGRVTSNGRKPFTASLDWLLKAENFAKVREGHYENERTA